MKLIYQLILLTAFTLLITGCSTEQLRDPMTNEHQEKLIIVDEKILQLQTRVDTLEAGQLSAEDIRNLANLMSQNKNYLNTTDVTIGCPSAYDVDIKWFDAKGRGDISQDQYDKILKRYNDEDCQWKI